MRNYDDDAVDDTADDNDTADSDDADDNDTADSDDADDADNDDDADGADDGLMLWCGLTLWEEMAHLLMKEPKAGTPLQINILKCTTAFRKWKEDTSENFVFL